MKQIILFFACFLQLLTCFAQENISIIPQPVKLTKNEGHFILPANISINADDNPGLKTALADLTDRLTIPTGYHVTMTKSGSSSYPDQPE